MANEAKLKEEIEELRAQQMIASIGQIENQESDEEASHLPQCGPSLEDVMEIVKANSTKTEASHKAFIDKMNDIMRKPTKKMMHKVKLMVS